VSLVPTGDQPEATAIAPSVRDNNNGTYTVTYTPSETQFGTYAMTTTINGVAVPAATLNVAIAGTPRKRDSLTHTHTHTLWGSTCVRTHRHTCVHTRTK
jgi:PKD repeat protein